MIRLTVGNRLTRLEGLDPKTLRKLEAACSYLVEGYYFSPAYRAHRWDGKEHLLTFSKKHGYNVPTGLLTLVVNKLRKAGQKFSVIDATEVRGKRRQIGFSVDLRGYQKKAIKAILSPPLRGRGILKMPIRSGKTKTTAGIIARLGLPTLFLVPSKGLLHQTAKALRESFPGQSIGMIGDGVYEVERITVATLQTLQRMRGKKAGKKKDKDGGWVKAPAIPRDARYDELMRAFDVVVCDEVHHIRGDGEWHLVVHDLDARYKIGLSATAFLRSKVEQARGAIWMRAICGPVRIDIATSDLIEDGFLMKQNVQLYPVTTPDQHGKKWSQILRQRCIIQNKARNQLIARLAKEQTDKGLRVLIVARHLDHIALIVEELESAGLRARSVTGKNDQSERESAVEALVARRVHALVGNVLGEGMDLPEVEVVINAEGGKDDKNTVQRQRNLTMAKGKTTAILIDFLDQTNEIFEKHAKDRRAMYESESAFSVQVMKDGC